MAATRKKATRAKKKRSKKATAKREPRGRAVRASDIEPRYPWERQPKETARAFSAFSHYLDTDPEERSIRGTYRKLGLNWSTVSMWSSKYDWMRRSEAKDRHDWKKKQRINERAIRKMNERQAETAMMAQAASMLTIGQHVKTDKNPNPIPLSDRDAIRLLAVATKLERVARGEPDTIAETKGEVGVKVTTVDDRRASMVKLLENEEAMRHMAEISKLLGTDGGYGD